jgi:hypothetical protein
MAKGNKKEEKWIKERERESERAVCEKKKNLLRL